MSTPKTHQDVSYLHVNALMKPSALIDIVKERIISDAASNTRASSVLLFKNGKKFDQLVCSGNKARVDADSIAIRRHQIGPA